MPAYAVYTRPENLSGTRIPTSNIFGYPKPGGTLSPRQAKPLVLTGPITPAKTSHAEMQKYRGPEPFTYPYCQEAEQVYVPSAFSEEDDRA